MVISEDTGSGHNIKSVLEVLWVSCWGSKEKFDKLFVNSWLALLSFLEHTWGGIEANDVFESILMKILTN